jgi:hypothetical protein
LLSEEMALARTAATIGALVAGWCEKRLETAGNLNPDFLQGR